MTDIRDGGCVVLGAGGFIGANLCRRLVSEGQSPRAFGPIGAAAEGLPIRWRVGRLADRAALGRALAGMRTVVHLASSASPHASDAAAAILQAKNVADTEQMLRACVQCGVQRVIFLSSGGTVYAPNGASACSERSPTRGSTPYSESRLAIERVLNRYSERCGIETIVLRVSSVYGPHQRIDGTQGVISRFLFLALSGRPLRIWGDGTSVRDYVFVSDVVDAILAAMSRPAPSRRVLNIGTGVGTSLRQLVERIGRVVPLPIEVEYVAAPSGIVAANVLDVRAAADDLGWRPSTTIDEGLSVTARWLQKRAPWRERARNGARPLSAPQATS